METWRDDRGEWSPTIEPYGWNPEDASDVRGAFERSGYPLAAQAFQPSATTRSVLVWKK